jgi:capsule biosynthesis phosphatase
MKKLVIDLDDTISKTVAGDYENSIPIIPVINQIKKYKEEGFYIVIYSSRNMRTYENNLGKINIYTLPNIVSWLNKHNVPYDEIFVGKPWCGFDGFYIDDKAIRPSEFLANSYEKIKLILDQEKEKIKDLCTL